MDYKKFIKAYPDFPKQGKTFYDVSPLLADGHAWHDAIDTLSHKILAFNPDILVGIESRGFLMAAPIAHRLACGFIMVGRNDVLPGESFYKEFVGADGQPARIQIQSDKPLKGCRAVVLDDVLSSGKTTTATIELLQEMGATVVGAAFLLELSADERQCDLNIPYCTLASYSL